MNKRTMVVLGDVLIFGWQYDDEGQRRNNISLTYVSDFVYEFVCVISDAMSFSAKSS